MWVKKSSGGLEKLLSNIKEASLNFMNLKEKKKLEKQARLKRRLKKKIRGTPKCPRLLVVRANNNISAQLIDDVNQKTLTTIASVAGSYAQLKKSTSGKLEISKQIGLDIASAGKNLKIKTVVFDRNGCQYRGRVKMLAEGAREGGLQF